ncbi:MAG: putative manganese transporter [Fodinibius sp.]|nr:putative manganese transporter [Fodinibius sp.]
MIDSQEFWNILIFSVRDGFVQVSAFVAVTVLLFSYIQFRSGGRLVQFLENNQHLQPIAGALLGLTPGCGGAIIAMPLYIRGSVSFGTVVATLAATAGDSAFIILTQAPVAAFYAYGMAAFAGISFGYAIDWWGLGIGRLDRAVQQLSETMEHNGFATSSVASSDASIAGFEASARKNTSTTINSAWADALLRKFTHLIHILWWIVGLAGLVAGVEYLRRGAPEVPMEFGLTFPALFTVAGLAGTVLSFYLYFIGRRFIGEDDTGQLHDLSSSYDSFRHAAMETSMVTVWVIAAYLLYEYSISMFSLNIGALAAAAGIWAPIAGAGLGLVPGCGPQIVFATLYASSQIPFSALVANAISQDGDALFPLMAIDMKAAIIATIYTTIPALIIGILLYYIWPYANIGFGVLG